ncbi:hypothetical protein JHK82_055082 [Glycine max]|nr:hypothetical protein JHK82_055082 [Glycine max]
MLPNRFLTPARTGGSYGVGQTRVINQKTIFGKDGQEFRLTVVALLIFWLVLIKVGIPRVVVVVTGSGLFGKPVFLSVSIDAATGQGWGWTIWTSTLASQNLEEFTPLFFRVFKSPNKHIVLLCSDARSSSLKSDLYKPQFAGFVDVDLATDKKIFLRSLIDHSVVESFGAGGKTNILSRVYPELAVMNQAYLFVFNNGTEPIVVENLKAWSMISADIK